jgi:hypothetical protein
MTDNSGLFHVQTFRQTNQESIKSTGSPQISKIRAIHTLPYTYPTKTMKHAYGAILSYLHHIYQKGYRCSHMPTPVCGINNFKTNTRARPRVIIQRKNTPMFFNVFYTNKRVIMQPLEFCEPIKRKEDQDTRKDKTICARQNHLLPLLPQNLTFITI